MGSESRKKWAKLYTDALIALGVAALGCSLVRLASSPPGLEWMLLAIVTAFISMRVAIRIPTVKSEMTIYDTFVFVSIFLHGVEAATVLAAIAGYGASVRCAKTKRSYAVNITTVALSVFVAGRITRWLLGGQLR